MMTMRKATDRGHANHGWLDTYFTFSFADYYDPQQLGFRALRVINDDTIGPGGGFGSHPHRDMEILTYVLSGALKHRDSMGSESVMKAGWAQRISAGTGIFHSEFNASETDPVHLLQIWILPDRKGVKPRYAEKSFADAPTGQWHRLASPDGREGSLAIHQDAEVLLGKLVQGDALERELRPGRHAWIHVAEGEAAVNGQLLKAGDALALSGEPRVSVAGRGPSQVLFFDLN